MSKSLEIKSNMNALFFWLRYIFLFLVVLAWVTPYSEDFLKPIDLIKFLTRVITVVSVIFFVAMYLFIKLFS